MALILAYSAPHSRQIHSPDLLPGSSQLNGAIVLICEWATLAQLVEHLIRNERVVSSILTGGSSLSYSWPDSWHRLTAGGKRWCSP